MFYIYFSVCTRRDGIARKSSLRKRKRQEENTIGMKKKIRKVDNDELTFRAEIERRMVSKLIEEIDGLLDENKKDSNGRVGLVHGPTQSVDELLIDIEEFLADD